MLAGCAATGGAGLPDLGDWDRRKAVLAEADEYEFSGRIGVSAASEGFNGKLWWRQDGIVYRARISGPIGVGTVFVNGDGREVTLTDRDGVVNARTSGRDAVATVNGISATSNGLELAFSSSLLKVEMTLAEDYGNGTTGLGTSSFAITEGGALFQLGPQVNTNLQENIGVKSMQANKLGNSVVGYLSELKSGQARALDTGNFPEASRIVQEVITQVAVLRGRLGAFERNTLQPNIRQLQITTENLISSESTIRDTDFASETSELTRSQILVQAGNSILAIANAQSQNVLTLLGG